jgi:hypothetical protein
VKIQALRTVLLAQAIEESDRGGDVLPLADRAEATREALRATERAPAALQIGPAAAGLSRPAEAFLARRAELLLSRVRARSPAVDHVLAVAAGLTWLGRTVLVLATLVGLGLSALDGSHRINILSFPLVGLVAWNLFVYAVLIAARLKRRRRGGLGPGAGGFWSGRVYERWIARRVDSLLHQSTRFNAPLATALRRFTSAWAAVVHPLLLERAKLLMHLAAALLAVGLILGLYVRGLVFRYEAGWESTFLTASAVHTLVALFYGPAAAVSGIGVPSTDVIASLRWAGNSGGAEAASWIHLIALTAALYIVIPRLTLALLSRVKLWRLSLGPPLPASLMGHARTVLTSASGGVVLESAAVVPFAYEPSPESITGLRTLLGAALGAGVSVSVRAPVQYGEEEAFRDSLANGLADPDGWLVLLMTLASTPEVENHGTIIATLRDRCASRPGASPLLVIIDTGPYAARMQRGAELEQRLQERRRLWSQFVAGYGLRACIVDLSRIVPGAPSESEARDQARAALWSS